MQVWRTLVIGKKKRRGKIHTYSEGERNLLQSGFDETAHLHDNSNWIASALGVEQVVIHVAGEGEDVANKARTAMPLEPGIAYR